MGLLISSRLASFLLFCFILLSGASCKKEEEKSQSIFSINISSHQNDQYVNVPTINISGAYTVPEEVSPSSVEIKLKDDPVSLLANGRFEISDVPLKMGKNKIHLKLFVEGEVRAQTSIWITYSDYYLEILSPFDGQVFRDGEIDINGIYEYPEGVDPSDLSVKIDSHLDATINPDGTFSYESYQLKKGTHSLTAKLYLKNKEKFRDINEVKYYETNQTPKAKFFVDPMEGKSPMLVAIDGSSSSDTDGSVTRWLWTLGDGTTQETTTPHLNHTYKWVLRGCDGETREHTVTLQVIDNDGGISKTHKKVITLECEPNSPPVVGADQVENGQEDTVLNFSLNPATDVDGDDLTYHLVFGPNVGTLNGCLDGTDSAVCEYIPLANYFGTVSFTYKVNDGIYDSESEATVTINLAPVNDAPEMRGNQSFETNEDTPLDFTLIGASDIDGDVLNYRLIDLPQNAELKDCLQSNGDLSCRLVPSANFYGKVTFSYVANDGQVDADTISTVEVNVLPINDAPIMVGDQNFSGTEDNTLSFSLSGATDIENNPLTYSVVQSPANGSLTNCLEGTNDLTCDFIPAPNFNGQVIFTYAANDGLTNSSNIGTVTLSLAAVNDVPVLGGNQTLQTNEDDAITFNLNPASDVDEDVLKYKILTPVSSGTLSGCGDLTTSSTCTFVPGENFNGAVSFTYTVNDGQVDAVGVATVEINVVPVNDAPTVGQDQTLATSEDVVLEFTLSSGSDIENDPLTYRIMTDPVGGIISGCGQGGASRNCTFTPDKDFNGAVNFTYKVNDGQDDSVSTAKVTINVAPVNDAPIVGENQTIEGEEDTSLSFSINSALDVENDTLIYEIVDAPNNGTLNGCLDGTASLNCTFVADENFYGAIEFTYRAFDDELYTTQNGKITLNVISVNDAPIMPDDQNFEVNEDNQLELNLLGASDIEEDSLTYSIVQTPTHGSLSECLQGTADLSCRFVPEQDFFGEVSFTYKANDGMDDSETVTTVKINVLSVNDPPVMGEDQNFTIDENTSLSFNVNPASDVEGDNLTYKVILPPGNGILEECMNNNGDLSCVYTPPTNFYGDVIIRYRANDGTDSTEKLGSIYIKVLMVNEAPVMAANTSFEMNEDTTLDFIVPVATDADGDALTYKIIKQPSVGILSGCLEENSDLACSYSPPDNFSGLVTFTYRANDGRLDAGNETEVTIDVKEVNDPPYLGEPQSFALNENSNLKFTLSPGGDLEDDEISYVIVTAPQNGQIIGCLDSSDSTVCEYKPNTDFKGTDSLTYKANDGQNDSISKANIDFTINEINRAPVLSMSSTYETNEDTSMSITLAAATDLNGDNLTYWIDSPPNDGKIENCLIGTNDLVCDFIPSEDFNGSVSFSYFAFDGALRSANSHNVLINVLPVNDPPVLGDNQEFIFNEDEKLTFTINKATDVDSDDSLIFYSIITPPSHGVLQNCLNFTNDLECEYVPEPNFYGEVEFTYVASDETSFSLEIGRVLLNIQPINDAPYFENAQLIEVNADQTSEIVLDPAVDKDGNVLVYEIVDAPSNATISNCLGGTSDLTCDFLPASNYKGEVTFLIRAFDGEAYSENQKISISVVTPETYVTQIDTGTYHSCAVMNIGDVYCWGRGFHGALGYGNTDNIGDDELPASVGKVSVGGRVRKIATGLTHTCALLESGDVKCWGGNSFGELGQGNTLTIGDNELPSSIPVVEIGAKVKDIVTGLYHTCVILETDDVKCWGGNPYGTLGLSRTDNVGDNEKPVDVPSLNIGAKVTKLAAGYHHTCALLESGDVKCWGNNGRVYQSCYTRTRCSPFRGCSFYRVCNNYTDDWGALGLGYLTIVGDNEHPASVPNVEIGGKAIDISATERGTCVVLDNHQLRCWGKNQHGELGYGNLQTIGDNELPIAIDPIDVGFAVKSVDGGQSVTCAISTDDEMKCWGANNYGGLGQGNTTQVGTVSAPSIIDSIQLGQGVFQAGAGSFTNCALLDSKEVKCFGLGSFGQLGLGTTDNIGDDEFPTSTPAIGLSGSFPSAVIDFAENTYQAPVNIIFNGMASTPSSDTGSIVAYDWNFGDGGTSIDAVTNHTFTKGGVYQIRLIVTDDEGLVGIAKRTIIILPEPMPTAIITSSANSGNASLKINFNGENSTPSETGESITSYHWDFGNGKTSSLSAPETVYTGSGVYTAKLTVVDTKNREHTSSKTITVFDSLPPIADFSYSSDTLRAPVTLSFNGAASTAGSYDGTIEKYEWDFGGLGTAIGQTPSYTFNEGGSFNILLKVTDDRGKVGLKTIQLEILPELKPVARFTQDIGSGYRPLIVSFDATTSTPSNVDGQITSFNWNFGNGQTATGATASTTFLEQGIFDVVLEVTDDLGKKSVTTSQVEVLPKTPPVAQINIVSETLYPHIPFDITLDGSGSDPGAGGGSIVSYLWDMGDGTTKSGLNITHRYARPGTFQIVLTVENSDGEKSSKMIEKDIHPALLVNVSSSNLTYFAGHWVKFEALVKDHDAKDVTYPVVWESSDPSILEIRPDGFAQTKAPGLASVTAKVGNNQSLPLNFEVKEKSLNPTLIIPDDYFAKTFEQKIIGGAFGLTLAPYVTATYSPFDKQSVNSSGFFSQAFSLLPGVSITALKSFDGGVLVGQSTREIRFFDGLGNSLLFDEADEQVLVSVDANDTASSKLNFSFWLRLSDVSLAGKVFDLVDENGLGLKVEFDFRKTPIISIDQTEQKIYLVGDLLKADEWTHLSINIDADANKLQLLQNGKIVSENNLYQSPSWMGQTLSGILGGTNFKGLVDEFQIFHTTLSESHVKTLMFEGEITTTPPATKFSFEGAPSQNYFGSLFSKMTLGIGNGYDQEDPSLRFSSEVLGKKTYTVQEGGLLSLEDDRSLLDPLKKLSFEVAPLVLEQDSEITVELLDAKTPGYLPKGILETEYLLRFHPVSGKRFKSPSTLTLPIQAEKIKTFGSINLFFYQKSAGAIYRKRPINVNTNEQVATFPIVDLGTYFSSYDSSFLPSITYNGANVSDGAFDYSYDRRIDVKYKLVGSGPFVVELTGNADGANLYYASCNNGTLSYNNDFPISIQGLPLGNSYCYLYFKKPIDDQTNLYIQHLIDIQIEN